MRISLKYIIVALFVLSATACGEKIENIKTETVKIYGNCGMCKSTIEKAGNKKNQSKVDWNKDTKMATISYDSLQTTKEDILDRIAGVGYDSKNFSATADAYGKLPECCQYKRAK